MPGWKIYALKDPRDGVIRYIGRTRDETKRYKSHLWFSQLNESHKSRWIRQLFSLNLKPTLEILASEVEDSAATERAWIARLRSDGYNLTNSTDGGDGVCGMSVSAETRAKLSAARKHIIYTDEWRANLSRALTGRRCPQKAIDHIRTLNLGKVRPPEHCRKLGIRSPEAAARIAQCMREKLTGKKQSAEFIAKRTAGLRGKKRTAEQRARMSAAGKGKIISVEARRNMGIAQRKRPKFSDETRAKIVKALTGRPVSDESRSKMRDSALKREALKRQLRNL